MIYACDAIMGSGKSSAAITYMNEHPEKRFIYITPYLDEARRIKNECPDLKFVEPVKGIKECGFTKTGHTLKLLEDGRNIATTHQAFTFYTKETLDAIRSSGYTLIIDESVNVLEYVKCDPGDIDLLIRAGVFADNGGELTLSNEEYTGSAFKEIIRLIHSRELIRSDDYENEKEIIYYWLLPKLLVEAFDDIYILTYLFGGQDIHHFLVMNKLPYQYIGVRKDCDGKYRFCENVCIMPDYTGGLSNMIHICQHDKLNDIGENRFALSMNWFDTHADDVDVLKNNIYNYFRNVTGDINSSRRMWGTYSDSKHALRGKGYTNKYVVFNSRAVNEYRDRTVLAYAANPFMNVGQKCFYEKHGVVVNEDDYALSTMVQWVWRSAIRDGKEIWIYIPSKRMRKMLQEWIERVETQYEEYRNQRGD